ncbi:MAG: SRPBCC domain-containing protein [Bauldia sp.]|nr:SRPBCC domain-containing protein [Bauldia sp.]
MPVKKEASGRRSVEAEIEVPGSPEEVWRAIASGPGISSWFVPTTLEERAGGTTASSFGPGMDSVATITAWDPPRRFAAETQEEPGTVATEWTVEAKAGGTCVVRVVHSWFASTDDWDDQFEGHSQGWIGFFQILRLYLTHFRGQTATSVQLMAMSGETPEAAWARLAGPLGLTGASAGDNVSAPAGAPPFHGVVETANPPEHPALLLRLDRPAPALAHFFAMPMGGQVLLPVRFYLYGPAAADLAPGIEKTWQAWLDQRFPPAPPPS